MRRENDVFSAPFGVTWTEKSWHKVAKVRVLGPLACGLVQNVPYKQVPLKAGRAYTSEQQSTAAHLVAFVVARVPVALACLALLLFSLLVCIRVRLGGV